MALTVSQAVAASFNGVRTKKRAENQWAEASLMRVFEEGGYIKRVGLGNQIEHTLDYQRNPNGDFLATDLTPTAMVKTEVLTAALYDPAQFSVPGVWSKMDEAKNSSAEQKVDLVDSIISNLLDSHDDYFEEALFATSTDGFLGLNSILPMTGQGNVGGIDASLELFWRHPVDSYLADGSDIEATLTEVWNDTIKGTGSKYTPRDLVSGSDPISLFESTQGTKQRYEGQTFKAGATKLMFKTAQWSFSKYGGSKVYGLNPKAIELTVSKDFFREKGTVKELENAEGYKVTCYTAGQLGTGNKSRLFVVDVA